MIDATGWDLAGLCEAGTGTDGCGFLGVDDEGVGFVGHWVDGCN